MKQGSVFLASVAALILAATSLAQQQGLSPAAPQTPPEAFEPVDSTFVPSVVSKTAALQVLDVSRRDPYLRIRLKNVSDKKISSFRMSYHRNGTSMLITTIEHDEKDALAPGEIYKYEHSYTPTSTLAREPLTFEAVLFADGTGDGEAIKVKSLQDVHNASRKELESVVALLQTAIDAPNIETFGIIDDLEKDVSEIPDYMEGVTASGLAGVFFTSWKGTSLHFIREIKRRLLEGEEVKIREELSKIKQRFAKPLAKFPNTI